MQIRCEACGTLIQIPNERVPPKSTFRLTCPRCKRKILANTRTTDSMEGDGMNVSSTLGTSGIASVVDDNAVNELPDAMDSLPPGQSAALLCINREESRGELKGMLEGLGYVVDIPATSDHAFQRLRFNQYRIILLDDDLGGKSVNSVAGYLAGLNMNSRRDMFVVLIGAHFKTADHLQAFIESVNLVVHPNDLPQLATFLARGLRDHERFYKVFVECLIEAGKKI
jgi:CheY-like chemotaxis protein